MTAARARLPAAVVIGLDSITGLQTARILAGRRIPVTGIARNLRHPSCRTRACDRIVLASTGGAALADCLERLAADFAEPPVLFPCTDLSVLAISTHRQRLADGYRYVLPAPGVIELLLDKARFQAHATNVGLPIPRTAVLRDCGDVARAVDALRFPCVLKPAVKTARWQSHTSAKVFRVADAAALLKCYDRCRYWTELLVAQEWIEGPDTSHVTCNAYFDAGSQPYLTFVSRKLRQWPLEGGVGCLSQECRNDVVRRETIHLFQGVGHRGLAYLEMKITAEGDRAVIIEPNVGRPTGRSAAADASGVDLVYTQYCDALGWPLPPAREQTYGNRKWIYLRQDLQAAGRHWKRGTLTLAGWARSVRGCRHDAVFAWRDPAPFFADLSAGFGKALATPSGDSRKLAVPPAGAVDLDLQGVVGIRLVGASPADVALVTRQLGVSPSPLHRIPDIVLRFVDELPTSGLRWLELGRTGYTENAFFVSGGGDRASGMQVPLDRVGGTCEIVCRRGGHSIPLLAAIVNLTAVQHGCVPLHASAFVHDGAGVVVTGWARGGKTGALLAFAADGAEFVGDDWIMLTADRRVVGIPETVHVQAWHLHQLPHLRRRLTASRRLLLAGVGALERLDGLVPITRLARQLPVRALRDPLPALKRRLKVEVRPGETFRVREGRFADSLDRIFFLVSHDAPTILVERADPLEIAGRLAASVRYEQLPLTSAYLAYLGAFPGRRNRRLERAGAVQTARLRRLLAGKDAYVVRHPYPCRLQELFQAMAPFCHAGLPAALPEAPERPYVMASVTAQVGDG